MGIGVDLNNYRTHPGGGDSKERAPATGRVPEENKLTGGKTSDPAPAGSFFCLVNTSLLFIESPNYLCMKVKLCTPSDVMINQITIAKFRL